MLYVNTKIKSSVIFTPKWIYLPYLKVCEKKVTEYMILVTDTNDQLLCLLAWWRKAEMQLTEDTNTAQVPSMLVL